MTSQSPSFEGRPRRPRSRLQFWLVLLICFAPFSAAFIVWHFELGPDARTNYGDFVDPQKPVPPFAATALEPAMPPLPSLKGKWLMLHADVAACATDCARQLYVMRQVRASLNEGQQRVERAWLVLDDTPVNPEVLAAYAGMNIYRVRADDWRAFLPVADGTRIEDHIYLIDPLGNLMLRWPRDVDPKEMRKDAVRLLRASRIG
ncbi:cytochrome c oxidase subunit I [soil metagenome]